MRPLQLTQPPDEDSYVKSFGSWRGLRLHSLGTFHQPERSSHFHTTALRVPSTQVNGLPPGGFAKARNWRCAEEPALCSLEVSFPRIGCQLSLVLHHQSSLTTGRYTTVALCGLRTVLVRREMILYRRKTMLMGFQQPVSRKPWAGGSDQFRKFSIGQVVQARP